MIVLLYFYNINFYYHNYYYHTIIITFTFKLFKLLKLS